MATPGYSSKPGGAGAVGAGSEVLTSGVVAVVGTAIPSGSYINLASLVYPLN